MIQRRQVTEYLLNILLRLLNPHLELSKIDTPLGDPPAIHVWCCFSLEKTLFTVVKRAFGSPHWCHCCPSDKDSTTTWWNASILGKLKTFSKFLVLSVLVFEVLWVMQELCYDSFWGAVNLELLQAISISLDRPGTSLLLMYKETWNTGHAFSFERLTIFHPTSPTALTSKALRWIWRHEDLWPYRFFLVGVV